VLRNCLCVPVRGNAPSTSPAGIPSGGGSSSDGSSSAKGAGDDKLGKVVAVIQVLNKRSGPWFTAEDVQILQFVGLLAGQSLSNAQLYADALVRRRQQEALCTMIELMSTSADVDEVIKCIIDAAYRLLEVDRISLYMVDEERNQLLCKVSKDANAVGQRLPRTWGIIGRVAAEGKISNINDAANDPEFDKTLDKVCILSHSTRLCTNASTPFLPLSSSSASADESFDSMLYVLTSWRTLVPRTWPRSCRFAVCLAFAPCLFGGSGGHSRWTVGDDCLQWRGCRGRALKRHIL
jgi:GAF domain-containing protein